jgi:hypothetical protein
MKQVLATTLVCGAISAAMGYGTHNPDAIGGLSLLGDVLTSALPGLVIGVVIGAVVQFFLWLLG